jgi:hypothetical protein
MHRRPVNPANELAGRERSGVLPAADLPIARSRQGPEPVEGRQIFPVGTRHTCAFPNVCAPPAQPVLGGWKHAAPLGNLRFTRWAVRR